ncbi:MAG TPA: hypothetical protein VFW11_14790 [Cyclobacteriaceae bacterium]|nr:hypothetical protein [Cyclobacteriaceae bacterium]
MIFGILGWLNWRALGGIREVKLSYIFLYAVILLTLIVLFNFVYRRLKKKDKT